MGITSQLAGEIVNTKFEDIPEHAVQHTKRAIMDDIGIAFLGYLTVGAPLVNFAKIVGGTPESTIVGDGVKVSCALAAGINAEMAANSGMNETGPGVHALSSCAETAIAVGERVGASGKDIIAATAIAYELNGRFARNLKDKAPVVHIYERHVRRHLAITATFGAARILGLKADDVNRAIGLGWMTVPTSMELLLKKAPWFRTHNIWVSQLGIEAALAITAGLGGPEDVLEKDASDIYHLDKLDRSPSPFYYVSSEMCLKPWLGSYGFMGGIELVKTIVEENSLKPDGIEQITFRGSKLYTTPPFNVPEPKDHITAANNVPWSFAMVILGYESALDWVSPERLQDPVALKLAKKVKTEEGESPLVNEVEIITRKTKYQKKIARNDFIGNPKRITSGGLFEAKFRSLVSKALGKAKTEKLASLLNNLEKVKDIREVTGLYKAG